MLLSNLLMCRINCQICQQPLSQRAGGKRRGVMPWTWGRGGKQGGKQGSGGSSSSAFLMCDCCQRCYHKGCCKARGVSTREDKRGQWFHSEACRRCQDGLAQQVTAGPVAVPGGRTWQLVDCAPVDASDSSGLAALRALKKHLSDVLEVLLPAYGPGAAQQLVDTNKGHAVVLRQGSLPLTAGLLDVYGQVRGAGAASGRHHCPGVLAPRKERCTRSGIMMKPLCCCARIRAGGGCAGPRGDRD
jgi:hypothetical protein